MYMYKSMYVCMYVYLLYICTHIRVLGQIRRTLVGAVAAVVVVADGREGRRRRGDEARRVNYTYFERARARAHTVIDSHSGKENTSLIFVPSMCPTRLVVKIEWGK